MNNQRHIISREVFELTTSEYDKALPIRNKAEAIIKEKLNPALERLFSTISSDDEYIRIEKLEVDLGSITEDELTGGAFTEKVLKSIKESLDPLSREKATLLRSESKSNNKQTNNIRRFSKREDALEQFIFFLQNGHFPWWHENSLKENSINSILSAILEIKANQLKTRLVPLLKDQNVRDRLVLQLEKKQLDILLNKMDPVHYKKLWELSGYLFRQPREGQIPGISGIHYYKVILQHFEGKNPSAKTNFLKALLKQSTASFSPAKKEAFFANALKNLFERLSSVPEEDKSCLMTAIVDTLIASFSKTTRRDRQEPFTREGDLTRSLTEWLRKNLNGYFPPELEKIIITNYFSKTENKDKPRDSFLPFDVGPKKASLTRDKQGGQQSFHGKGPINDEEIIIFNAGLVLVHPFLPFFFGGLNLLDDLQQFLSREHAHKAVHLLQFIVTGRENTPEYDLALNKVLCGLPVSEPLPKELPLSEQEKEECIHLVKTILQRWKALKTENPEALRTTYFQREGKLYPSGQGWTLTIERNTFDVMLEKLPWGFSIIKLPWNPQILYVEW